MQVGASGDSTKPYPDSINPYPDSTNPYPDSTNPCEVTSSVRRLSISAIATAPSSAISYAMVWGLWFKV